MSAAFAAFTMCNDENSDATDIADLGVSTLDIDEDLWGLVGTCLPVESCVLLRLDLEDECRMAGVRRDSRALGSSRLV